MLLLGVFLAFSVVTVLAVVVACEVQARAARTTTRVIVLPGDDEQRRFEAIVAPLLADPEFGRIDR